MTNIKIVKKNAVTTATISFKEQFRTIFTRNHAWVRSIPRSIVVPESKMIIEYTNTGYYSLNLLVVKFGLVFKVGGRKGLFPCGLGSRYDLVYDCGNWVGNFPWVNAEQYEYGKLELNNSFELNNNTAKAIADIFWRSSFEVDERYLQNQVYISSMAGEFFNLSSGKTINITKVNPKFILDNKHLLTDRHLILLNLIFKNKAFTEGNSEKLNIQKAIDGLLSEVSHVIYTKGLNYLISIFDNEFDFDFSIVLNRFKSYQGAIKKIEETRCYRYNKRKSTNNNKRGSYVNRKM